MSYWLDAYTCNVLNHELKTCDGIYSKSILVRPVDPIHLMFPILELHYNQLKEECPGCGSLRVETLQNRRLSPSLLQHKPMTREIQKPTKGLSSDLQVAYQQLESDAIRFAFDIEKLDSLYATKKTRRFR
jgi:hypothetical protein